MRDDAITARRWLELALAAANLALAVWFVLAILSGPGLSRPRTGAEWIVWIARGYLIEVLVLGTLVLLALLVEFRRGTPWLRLMWGCLGALAGLAILGAWSIGPAILPGLLLGYVAGSLAALRTHARFGRLVAWSLVGLGSQVALMLLIIVVAMAASPGAGSSQQFFERFERDPVTPLTNGRNLGPAFGRREETSFGLALTTSSLSLVPISEKRLF